MDSWEWNKIAGAVLGTLLFVLVVNLIASKVLSAPPAKKPGYVVEAVEEAGQTAGAPSAEVVPDLAALLPAASVAHGKEVAVRCQVCHDEARGGPDKIGPNLWSIVSRPRAANVGFAYSSAMSASHDPWTYEKLYTFLGAPQTDIPGNRMSYAGLRSTQDRVDLIAYLRTLSDNPAPLPAAKK